MNPFTWLTRKRVPVVEREKYLHVPFGIGKIGLGITFSEGKPSVVVFPPHRVGEPGEAYDGPSMDDGPPDGSIILTFHTDKGAHSLINIILAAIGQETDVEPDEAANDE